MVIGIQSITHVRLANEYTEIHHIYHSKRIYIYIYLYIYIYIYICIQLSFLQDEKKKYQNKYVIVELDGYPAKTIVIENNRKQ